MPREECSTTEDLSMLLQPLVAGEDPTPMLEYDCSYDQVAFVLWGGVCGCDTMNVISSLLLLYDLLSGSLRIFDTPIF